MINDLRKALTLQSWWTRHVNAQHSSQTTKTKGQSHLRATVARVREASYVYRACYRWLIKCSPQTAEKFGLKSLENPDLVLLSTWKDKKAYKRPNNRLPWIWSLRPIQASEPSEDNWVDDRLDEGLDDDVREPDEPHPALRPPGIRLTTLEDLIEKWRNECMCFPRNILCVVLMSSLVIRLDFVHTLAATERWTEEVRILTREMAATSRYFRHTALVWAQRSNDRSSALEGHKAGAVADEGGLSYSSDIRGYIAYASRQFDLYARLATESLRAFEDAVGASAWKNICLAPQDRDLVCEPKKDCN